MQKTQTHERTNSTRFPLSNSERVSLWCKPKWKPILTNAYQMEMFFCELQTLEIDLWGKWIHMHIHKVQMEMFYEVQIWEKGFKFNWISIDKKIVHIETIMNYRLWKYVFVPNEYPYTQKQSKWNFFELQILEIGFKFNWVHKHRKKSL